MKKLLDKKFREEEQAIKRRLAGKKSTATAEYNRKLKQYLNSKKGLGIK